MIVEKTYVTDGVLHSHYQNDGSNLRYVSNKDLNRDPKVYFYQEEGDKHANSKADLMDVLEKRRIGDRILNKDELEWLERARLKGMAHCGLIEQTTAMTDDEWKAYCIAQGAR
jgi:hypothetical protein